MCGLWTKIWMEKFRLCPPPDIPVGRVAFWRGHLPTVLRPESLPQLSSEDKHFSPESRGGMLLQEEREGGLFDGSQAVLYIYILFSENVTHPHWSVIPSSPSSLSSSHHTPCTSLCSPLVFCQFPLNPVSATRGCAAVGLVGNNPGVLETDQRLQPPRISRISWFLLLQ